METFILVLHLVITIAMVILIILQPGEGASYGDSDANPLNTTFSRKSIKNAMNRTIFILGMLFIGISLLSSYVSQNYSSDKNLKNVLGSGVDSQVIQATPVEEQQPLLPNVK